MKSGSMVYQSLDRSEFMPFFIRIFHDQWDWIRDDGRAVPVNQKDFTIDCDGETLRFDVVFIAIHGDPGENGVLQAYLDSLDLPYTSCNREVSELTFDKHACKKVVGQFNLVRMAPSILLGCQEPCETDEVIRELGLPLFVKPNNNGSSVGVSKVKTAQELRPAILKACLEDHEVVVEAFMPGREITCGVLRDQDKIITFPITEIIPKNEFFDYDAKYTPGKSDEIVPADIPAAVASECQYISAALYEKLDCSGVVRFDYILDGETISFLEVNTIPGFTEASIVPKMARAHGWTLSRLFGTMVRNVFR